MNEYNFEERIGVLVNRTALKMKAGLQRSFKTNGYDLTADHWAVLNCLWEKEGLTQTEIAERLAKDKTNLTRILDIMQRNGLIKRDCHESDRRSYRVFPTAKASRMRNSLMTIAEEFVNMAVDGLSAKERQEIVRLMNIINRNLVK